MDKEVQGAIEVQYALQFAQEVMEVHAIQHTVEDKHLSDHEKDGSSVGEAGRPNEGTQQATYRGPRTRHNCYCG